MSGVNSALYESNRDALHEVFQHASLMTMNDHELLTMQHRLGIAGEWGVWEVPKEFLPEGQLQNASQRRCTAEQVVLGNDIAPDSERQAWAEIVRYGIARSLVPGARGLPKPSTVIAELKLLVRVAKKIVLLPYDAGSFWDKVPENEFSECGYVASVVANNLRRFKDRGFIRDCAREDPKVVGVAPERDRLDEEVHDSVDQGESWQPFSDSFASECGWRSIHIIKVLGPTLLGALERALEVPVKRREDGKSLHPRNQQIASAKARDAVISNWPWQTPEGEALDELGFELNVKSTRARGMLVGQQLPILDWPPKTFSDAWSLLAVLQGAHLFPICLASGPRSSEVCGLTEACLVEAPTVGKRIAGKTYKLVSDRSGRDRDFAAPDIVVMAILQQNRLARLVKRRSGVEGDHLWVHVRTFGRGRMGEQHNLLSRFLDDYVTKIKLRGFLGGPSRAHIHRFRKTLARIVALSMVNSPIILMDCFGHEDPDMTLRSYILSDKEIARDVLEVQRELVILMAVDAIHDSENLGGAVGEQLRKKKKDHLELLGKLEFEPQDAYEFAKRETFDGRSWLMVSPGVYCTLPSGDGGLCAKGQSGTNPAYCQGGCPFQLLTWDHKVICNDAIAEIVANLERAVMEDEPMLVSQWSGQLKNWLNRWPDIKLTWRSHPVVEKYGQFKA
ncbi:hypothetical protein [Pseudomonas shirazensis]|uniref:hypothetical protein n=1 Tax=Pseudomonas shirazensis TaxID=2745494 RepID=UPI003986DB97